MIDLRRSLYARYLLSLGLLACAMTQALQADDLRSLAPNDAGLYVELNELGRQANAFREGELSRRWQRHPLAELALFKGLGDVGRRVRDAHKILGVSREELWLQLLGQQALVAIWPEEPGRTPAAALLLIQTSRRDLLEQIFERIVTDAQRHGRHASEEHQLAGEPKRIDLVRPAEGKPPVYMTIVTHPQQAGPQPATAGLAIFTTNAKLLDHVLDKIPAASTEQHATPATSQTSPLVQITLRPRVWDHLIDAAPRSNDARQARGQQVMQATWHALESGVVSLDVAQQLKFQLDLDWQHDRLPEPMRELIRSLSGNPRLQRELVSDALVAISGRLELGRLLQTMLLPAGDAPSLLKPPESGFAAAFSTAIVGTLGPDWLVCLTPGRPNGDDRPPWPIDWLVAVDTQGFGADSAAAGEPFVHVIQQAATFGEAADRARRPDSPVRLDTERVDDRTLTRVSGVSQFKPHGELTITHSAGIIWAGSSRALVRDASAAKPAVSSDDSTQAGVPTHQLYADLAGLRRVIFEAAPSVAKIAAARNISAEQLQLEGQRLIRLLDIGDRLDARGYMTLDGLTIVAELEAVAP